MSDVYMVYCLFMYIFTLGAIVRYFSRGSEFTTKVKVGMVLNLIFAPIYTPFVLGAIAFDLDN